MGVDRSVAVALVSLTCAVAAACGGDRSEAGGDEEAPTTSTARTIALVEVRSGDCLTGLVVGQQERIRLEAATLTGCAQPHQVEVFATFPIGAELADDLGAAGAPYPGEQTIVEAADRGCTERLARTEVDRDSFGLLVLWPSVESWGAGDRTVACAAYDSVGDPFIGRTLPSL